MILDSFRSCALKFLTIILHPSGYSCRIGRALFRAMTLLIFGRPLNCKMFTEPLLEASQPGKLCFWKFLCPETNRGLLPAELWALGGFQTVDFCSWWQRTGCVVFVWCSAALLWVSAFDEKNFTFGVCGTTLSALCGFFLGTLWNIWLWSYKC